MPTRRLLPVLLLVLVPVALGGCFVPGGQPPAPKVVQESEPNNSIAEADRLPLAPRTFSGAIAAADDPGVSDYWTFTPHRAGVLTVDFVTCNGLVNLYLTTAADPGDISQCGSVSIALAAGEQAFLQVYGVTPNPSYELKATFAPAP